MRESRPGPAPAKTQQTGKTYRVGLIFSTSPVSEMTGPEPVHPLAKAFLQRLRTLGYILLSPIARMGTSVQDGWRESSRPELWAVCGLQRPTTDDCPHTSIIQIQSSSTAVEIAAPAMLLEEARQDRLRVATALRREPKAGEVAPSMAPF
jgi:hypothetical protein